MYAINILVFFFLLNHPILSKEFSCIERDSCNGTIIDYRSMNNSQLIKERNCFCDTACFQYDDCCEDIKHYRLKSPLQATCIDYMYPFRIRSEVYIPTVMPIWMVTTCLMNYQYTQLERNCTSLSEDDLFSLNPVAYIPMTSRITNITYRNIYCAQCNNEKIDSLINWSFQIVCTGLQQNLTMNYTYEFDLNQIPLPENERCITRLSFPLDSSTRIYPCKQQTIHSCPNSFSSNQTLIDLCSSVNAYRYVRQNHPIYMYTYSLYRNEYCLICHNVTNIDEEIEISCQHQLDDELIIDPKPKTGRHSIYRLSILFDPQTFALEMPTLALSDYQYHSSYQTHYTRDYPCRYFEVYDYLLHTCIILQNENDWRLTKNFNCQNPILIQNVKQINDTILFYSKRLDRKRGDFIILFSDAKKFILCGEKFSIIYIHHNRFITTVRYLSTIISLISLLIFLISFTQKSTLHNLPGKCLLMLAISLQLSQSMFLASGHLLEYSNRLWCIFSGIAIHLFYLSTFAWLTAISFDTCLTLTQMNRLDARVARNRFILYNVFVWVFSILIVSISVCLHLVLSENNPWSPNYGRILCSISSQYALITFFLCPIGFLVLINVIIFLRTIYVVYRIDKETQLARCSTTNNERSRIFLYFRLAILMGIHWIFLVICIICKKDFLWIVFDIINSLPGLFISISFLHKQTSLTNIKTIFRSSQSQLSSLGIGSNALTTTTTHNNRCLSVDASPNVQMSRKLDDITQKLDKLTRHLLKPNDNVSTPPFHHSASSL